MPDLALLIPLSICFIEFCANRIFCLALSACIFNLSVSNCATTVPSFTNCPLSTFKFFIVPPSSKDNFLTSSAAIYPL